MLNGRTTQGSERTRIKGFILQEDRFHSWLWAHHVPVCTASRGRPITGSLFPCRCWALVMEQGPRDHSDGFSQTGSFYTMTIPINRNRKLSPKLVKAENYFNRIMFKISMQPSPHPSLSLFWDKAGQEQVGGKWAGTSCVCSTGYTLSNVPHFIQTIASRFCVR